MISRTRHRLAVRGIVLHQNRLLLVNAYGDHRLGLWCAPGGGVELHQSLPENLKREIHEETGLTVTVEHPLLVNEFHDPEGDFHQVDLFFRCTLTGGTLDPSWADPEGVVKKRRFFTRDEVAGLAIRPLSLAQIAWDGVTSAHYDPLEPILK